MRRSRLLPLLSLVALGGCYQLQSPDMSVYAPYFARTAENSQARKRLDVTFLGTTSLYFNDGRNSILIDGFLTRPGNLMELFVGEIATDRAKVRTYLQRLGIEKIDAMPVFHSHYDHAMDTAYIARLTGAQVLGSASTAMIARGEALPESKITVIEPGKSYSFGQFRVTMFESKHVPLPALIEASGMMEDIERPLIQPAPMLSYREGATYAILVEHPLGNSLLHSGAFLPDEYPGRKYDNLFLCTPGLHRLSPQQQDAFYRQVVSAPGVKRIIPVHWDDFTRPLDQPLVPLPRFAEDLDAAMQFLSAKAKTDPKLRIQFLQAWDKLLLGYE